MVIKSYTRTDLYEFIHSDFYAILSKIPISYNRAIAQINNPGATDEDILLWVAYENAATIGYVGVLPDRLKTTKQDDRIFWLSCFWVDEDYRKSNTASALMMAVIREHRQQLMISNFLFSLEEDYYNIGIFKPVEYKNGCDFYLRARFTKLIISKFPRLRKTETVIQVAETTINQLFSVWQWLQPRIKRNFSIKTTVTFDNELDTFLTGFTSLHGMNQRSAAYFQWIYTYRWVTEGKKDKDSERYYFSSISDRFTYLPVKMYENNTLCGFAWLKIRDRALTISFLYTDDNKITGFADYILNIVKDEQIDVISCFDDRLTAELQQRKSRFILRRRRRQPYLTPLMLNCSIASLQEGEGDSVFT